MKGPTLAVLHSSSFLSCFKEKVLFLKVKSKMKYGMGLES